MLAFKCFYHVCNDMITTLMLNLFKLFCSGRSHLKILPDRSLQIVGIQQEDRGTYTCEGKIKNRPITRNLFISVVVNGEDIEELSIFVFSVVKVNLSA